MIHSIPKKSLFIFLFFLTAVFLTAVQAKADYFAISGLSQPPSEPELNQPWINLSEAIIFASILFIFAFFLYSLITIPGKHYAVSSPPFIQTSKIFKRDFMRYEREYRERNLMNYANSRIKKGAASEILYNNFAEITPHVREKVLEKISVDEGERVSFNLARTVLKNFRLIPEEERNKILLKLSGKKSEEIKMLISEILLSEFNKIPAVLRSNLLSAASSGRLKKTKENAIQIVYMNFTDIPKELREKIILDGINSLEIEETYIKAAIKRHEKSLPEELIDYASKKLNF